MSAAAVIVAAGTGQRFGNAGKSFTLAGGIPIALWSLRAAAVADSVDEIVLVCGEHSQAAALAALELLDTPKPVALILGGSRRQDSALAGIGAATPGVDLVAIHDAARPLATAELFDNVIAAARAFGAAIVAVPVSDTIKRVADDIVKETVPRDDLVTVQTPQAFRTSLLLEAFALADATGVTVTDEASMIESLGHTVHIVPGSIDNIKVTYPSDLVLVDALLRARAR